MTYHLKTKTMKFHFSILCFGLLISNGNLFGKSEPPRDLIPFLADLFNPDSQTNMTFIMHDECPSQFTNVITNTNLFTLEEQKLLMQIPFKYKNVTTNSGPAGSVLISLIRTNGYLEAWFQDTNSGAIDAISFCGMLSAKFRTKSGDGYDVDIGNADMYGISSLDYREIKKNTVNGLVANFYGEHCEDYMRCINGNVVDKWFSWERNEDYMLEIKVKSPLDYFRYMSRHIKM